MSSHLQVLHQQHHIKYKESNIIAMINPLTERSGLESSSLLSPEPRLLVSSPPWDQCLKSYADYYQAPIFACSNIPIQKFCLLDPSTRWMLNRLAVTRYRVSMAILRQITTTNSTAVLYTLALEDEEEDTTLNWRILLGGDNLFESAYALWKTSEHGKLVGKATMSDVTDGSVTSVGRWHEKFYKELSKAFTSRVTAMEINAEAEEMFKIQSPM
ncbi:hypothetical protein K432DRAFT_192810 [Lepidopterella palustris CBS 459.81]|uniref:Uncharacterized protein n=1 Tax=Lepidopterella palustris CBS 459.81 TaxID=1314670 RepID=A0A8E2EFQ8_9PEZI|nr:hypothetical protein K432DRAFT_192810 [Lepidopterella palustris CBS 459.81]